MKTLRSVGTLSMPIFAFALVLGYACKDEILDKMTHWLVYSNVRDVKDMPVQSPKFLNDDLLKWTQPDPRVRAEILKNEGT